MKAASFSRIWLGSDLDNGGLPEIQTEVSVRMKLFAAVK